MSSLTPQPHGRGDPTSPAGRGKHVRISEQSPTAFGNRLENHHPYGRNVLFPLSSIDGDDAGIGEQYEPAVPEVEHVLPPAMAETNRKVFPVSTFSPAPLPTELSLASPRHGQGQNLHRGLSVRRDLMRTWRGQQMLMERKKLNYGGSSTTPPTSPRGTSPRGVLGGGHRRLESLITAHTVLHSPKAAGVQRGLLGAEPPQESGFAGEQPTGPVSGAESTVMQDTTTGEKDDTIEHHNTRGPVAAATSGGRQGHSFSSAPGGMKGAIVKLESTIDETVGGGGDDGDDGACEMGRDGLPPRPGKQVQRGAPSFWNKGGRSNADRFHGPRRRLHDASLEKVIFNRILHDNVENADEVGAYTRAVPTPLRKNTPVVSRQSSRLGSRGSGGAESGGGPKAQRHGRPGSRQATLGPHPAVDAGAETLLRQEANDDRLKLRTAQNFFHLMSSGVVSEKDRSAMNTLAPYEEVGYKAVEASVLGMSPLPRYIVDDAVTNANPAQHQPVPSAIPISRGASRGVQSRTGASSRGKSRGGLESPSPWGGTMNMGDEQYDEIFTRKEAAEIIEIFNRRRRIHAEQKIRAQRLTTAQSRAERVQRVHTGGVMTPAPGAAALMGGGNFVPVQLDTACGSFFNTTLEMNGTIDKPPTAAGVGKTQGASTGTGGRGAEAAGLARSVPQGGTVLPPVNSGGTTAEVVAGGFPVRGMTPGAKFRMTKQAQKKQQQSSGSKGESKSTTAPGKNTFELSFSRAPKGFK